VSPVERIYFEWEKALAANDPEALLALYAPDAVLESPLIPHLIDKQQGICRGHEKIRPLFEVVAKRKPPVGQCFRTGYLTNGKRLIWEYPRAGPDGEQNGFRRGDGIE